MSLKLGVILIVVAFLCGCRRSEKNTETRPNPTATPQQAQASATPTPIPTPTAEETPFLITNSTKWKTVEEFDYQWKADQPVTHFKLEIPEGYNDPGDFHRIHIQPQGHAELVLNSVDGWIEYADPKFPDAYTKLKTRSLVQSKYVLILAHSEKPDVPPLVFLRGWNPVGPGQLSIIGWQPSGDLLQVFDKDLDPVDVKDVDGDGIQEIIGHPCLGEGVGAAVGLHGASYKPYQVYKIETPIHGAAVLSVPLTEKYTRQEYDGWAGPTCDPHSVILYSKDKTQKPQVMSEEEFEKMEKAVSPKH